MIQMMPEMYVSVDSVLVLHVVMPSVMLITFNHTSIDVALKSEIDLMKFQCLSKLPEGS